MFSGFEKCGDEINYKKIYIYVFLCVCVVHVINKDRIFTYFFFIYYNSMQFLCSCVHIYSCVIITVYLYIMLVVNKTGCSTRMAIFG